MQLRKTSTHPIMAADPTQGSLLDMTECAHETARAAGKMERLKSRESKAAWEQVTITYSLLREGKDVGHHAHVLQPAVAVSEWPWG